MTTARRIQSLIAPRQLTAQELEDGLRRIGQSAGLVEVRVPVPIQPLMIGMLQGAVECPDISHQKRAGLYAILFDVKAILSGLVPGLPEALLCELDADNAAFTAYSALSSTIDAPEYDMIPIQTTEGGQE